MLLITQSKIQLYGRESFQKNIVPVTISISVEFKNLQNMFIKSIFDYLKATFSSSGCFDDEFNIIIPCDSFITSLGFLRKSLYICPCGGCKYAGQFWYLCLDFSVGVNSAHEVMLKYSKNLFFSLYYVVYPVIEKVYTFRIHIGSSVILLS